jgi:protein tyrosine phosphatase (PTP) superfamily phosphohydrolase (DUF442 family)
MPRCRNLASVLLAGLAVAGCRSEKPAPPETTASPAVGAAPAPVAPVAPLAAAPAAAAQPLPPVKPLAGIENYRRLSQKIAQGGQPNGAASYAALKAEGIETILSVDGAAPDVEAARAAGLKYVHVPIGYDGVSADEQARIIKAVSEASGPVYVHCHHGQHRGPAAAAIAREAVDGLSNAEAVAELKESGCSPSYPGLFRDVQNWKAPSAATLAALGPLPSMVKPVGVRDTMAHVDQRLDLLKASQALKWAVPPNNPDVAPPHEAMMMLEAFRELQRLPEAQAKGPDFLAHAKAAEDAATALQAALAAGAADKADAAWITFKASCDSCHATYRN